MSKNFDGTYDIVHPDTYKCYKVRNIEAKSYEDLKVVEFVVIGDNYSWKFWAEYDGFVKANPHVAIVGQ